MPPNISGISCHFVL